MEIAIIFIIGALIFIGINIRVGNKLKVRTILDARMNELFPHLFKNEESEASREEMRKFGYPLMNGHDASNIINDLVSKLKLIIETEKDKAKQKRMELLYQKKWDLIHEIVKEIESERISTHSEHSYIYWLYWKAETQDNSFWVADTSAENFNESLKIHFDVIKTSFHNLVERFPRKLK